MRGKGLDHLLIPLTLKAHGDFLESWNSKGITLGNEARTSVWEVDRQGQTEQESEKGWLPI